jgi:hypothetical protein
MSTEPRIRVIKLAERKQRAKARIKKSRDAVRRPRQYEARDAADTVTGWVDDLRRQKRQSTDALSVFNSLFEDAT